MATVSTFEDILTAMRENPILREAMRRHVRDEEFNTQVLSEAHGDAASTDAWEASMPRGCTRARIQGIATSIICLTRQRTPTSSPKMKSMTWR